MGIARLLAKGWVLVCLYAGVHALRFALLSGGDPFVAAPRVIVSALLFAAMGLLFVGGYGVSGGSPKLHELRLSSLKLPDFIPRFNDAVFLVFVVLSFVDQVVYAPAHISGGVTHALESAIYFAIPGQRAIADRLGECAMDGGRVFTSAFTWLMAVVFVGSAVSRLKHTADLIRLERAVRPEMLGPIAPAAVVGIIAVLAIQCIFIGSVFPLLPCSAFTDLMGALLIGLAPLLVGYLIYAALATLMASGDTRKS